MGNLKIGVEFPVFIVFFAMMLSAPIYMNFIIYRTCYVLMGKNESDCAKLGLNTSDNATNELEKEVEPLANYINITIDLVTSIIPCILCIFVGPWSDKNGRKPVMIICLTGYVFSYAIKAIICAIPDISPWYLFANSIPILLTGGLPTLLTVSFCYIIDITNVETRGLRMGIMEAVIGLGMLSGLFASSYTFASIGYVGIFTLCTALLALALVITIVFLKETIDTTQDQDSSFFSLDNIKEMCHTTFKPREGYTRLLLLVCIASTIMYVTAESNSGTESLLLRSKFHWVLEKLTIYSTIRSIIPIVGGFFCIYILHKLLGVTEYPLIVVGLLLDAANTFIVAFAETNWQIYIAASLRGMAGVISPMIRSILSKIIPHEETGKVFSLSISLESLFVITFVPFYTIVYNNTIRSFPGAFDLIPFFLHIVNLLLFMFIIILKNRSNAIVYVQIQDED